jgi:cell division protein FtsQ
LAKLRVIEPEAYPQEILADEEPKYLRRQKPLEIKRRKFGRKAWKTYLRVALWTTAGIAGAGCAYICGQYLLNSNEMALLHPDQVHVTGNHYVDASSIVEVFAGDRGRSVLRIPLEERRLQLEAIPWVAQATVRRALPNTLQIDITERTPIAFLRDDNNLSLVDIHGVILEKPLRDDFHFPVVTGISSDMPVDDREQRMHLFAGFMQGVEAARPGATDQVSEVDVSDDHDLRVTLTGLQSDFLVGSAGAAPDAGSDTSAPLLVHFGDGDFESKFQTLLEKIGEVRAKVGPLESVDLRFDGELVANPDTSAAAAQAAPVAATKAPAVAAVKSTPKPALKTAAAHAARHSQ